MKQTMSKPFYLLQWGIWNKLRKHQEIWAVDTSHGGPLDGLELAAYRIRDSKLVLHSALGFNPSIWYKLIRAWTQNNFTGDGW